MPRTVHRIRSVVAAALTVITATAVPGPAEAFVGTSICFSFSIGNGPRYTFLAPNGMFGPWIGPLTDNGIYGAAGAGCGSANTYGLGGYQGFGYPGYSGYGFPGSGYPGWGGAGLGGYPGIGFPGYGGYGAGFPGYGYPGTGGYPGSFGNPYPGLGNGWGSPWGSPDGMSPLGIGGLPMQSPWSSPWGRGLGYSPYALLPYTSEAGQDGGSE